MVSNVDRIQAMQADVAELQKFAERYTVAWCSQAAATVAAFYSREAHFASTMEHRRWGGAQSHKPLNPS
jgi:hypothetical protein